MKTGLESLDTGAPEITYSGNQGPKSPQEDQQKMAEFQLQEYMEEFERVFPDMKDKRGTPDYMKELQDYFEGLASKQSEGIGDMAMKSGLIDEYRNYKMGQEDAGEPFMSPRDYYRSQEQDRMGVKDGGVMQLVKENKNGSRPGYRGGGADMGDPGRAADRAATGYGGSGKAASEGFNQNAQPGGQPPEVYGPSGPYNPEQALDRATKVALEEPKGILNKIPSTIKLAQKGINFLMKNQLEKNRLDYFKSEFPEYVDEDEGLVNLPANLQALYDEGKLHTDQALKAIKRLGQSEGVKSFEDFMFEDKGSPGLKLAGNVGGLGDKFVATRNPDGSPATYGYGPSTGRDGPPIILPMTTGMTTADANPEELGTEFTSQFTRNQLTDADKERISNIGGKSIFLADGGRASYADGGITDLRQGYFLGKLVKKAVRGIKKVVKSPVGKAALMAAPFFFPQVRAMIPGGTEGYGSLMRNKKGFMGSFFNKLLRQKNDAGLYSSFDPFKVGIAGLSALTYLKGKQDEDDEPSLDEYMKTASRGPGMDPRGIREYIAMNKGNINPMDYSFLNPAYYQTAADGGRIGLAAGGIGDLRGALSKEMFNLGEDEEDEIKKLAMGGSAGMPPVTMQPGGQDAQSFSDDESTGIPQATPTTTLPNQMPIPRPMMDPRMMQQMMAQRGNSMMNRGMPMMGGRMMAQEGGMMDMGGRIGFNMGGGADMGARVYAKEHQKMLVENIIAQLQSGNLEDQDRIMLEQQLKILSPQPMMAMGGRINRAEGGMMDMGGMEKDYRNEGGFVPIGGQERADDVPARLSKNEFVFTADAVRNAGGGDIDKGAEIMENMMENLEAGGKVSQGSQGLDGAREMFQTQQRLGEVL